VADRGSRRPHAGAASCPLSRERWGERLVFGGATGLHVRSRQSEYRTIASELHGDPLCVNDIIAGPRGQVYAGTFHWGPNGMEKHGRLVRCDPDGSLVIEDEGIEHANGLGLSPDDRTLYFTDSTARSISVYDVDPANGGLSGRRRFALPVLQVSSPHPCRRRRRSRP
jgi:sugar lactone lactonase YvrE